MNILFEIEWNCLGNGKLFKKKFFEENDNVTFLFLPNSATDDYIRCIGHEKVKKISLDYDTMENPVVYTIEKIIDEIDKIVFVSWKNHRKSLFYESIEEVNKNKNVPIDVFVLN